MTVKREVVNRLFRAPLFVYRALTELTTS